MGLDFSSPAYTSRFHWINEQLGVHALSTCTCKDGMVRRFWPKSSPPHDMPSKGQRNIAAISYCVLTLTLGHAIFLVSSTLDFVRAPDRPSMTLRRVTNYPCMGDRIFSIIFPE